MASSSSGVNPQHHLNQMIAELMHDPSALSSQSRDATVGDDNQVEINHEGERSQSNNYDGEVDEPHRPHHDDIPAEYSHICHNYQACDVITTAHLVINSLVLLGFNCDDYIDIYSGIAYDLPVLNVETFNKSNQKLLLIILHYVLSILDREEFHRAIHTFWPFLDNKEKSCFLRAVHQCLQRIISEEDNVEYHASILIEAKGKEVWFLLRFLTDKCLQIMIKTYSSHGYSAHGDHDDEDESFYLESYQNKYLIPNIRNNMPDMSIGGGHDDNNEDGEGEDHTVMTPGGIGVGGAPHRSLREIEDYLRRRILEDIDIQVQEICTLMLDYNDEQHEWATYIAELEERLKAAQREMDESNARMNGMHQSDEHHLLSPHAAHKRTDTLKRIYEQKTLLQNFLDSPLLGSVAKYLEEESAQQAANAAAQAAANNGKNAPDLNQKAKERMAKIMSPMRRALMTQEEIERHKANMRTAITQLVEKIDEVVGVL